MNAALIWKIEAHENSARNEVYWVIFIQSLISLPNLLQRIVMRIKKGGEESEILP